MPIKVAAAVFLFMFGFTVSRGAQLGSAIVHTGTSGASALVGLPEDLFAMADDEVPVLRVYSTKTLGGPIAQFDLSTFLRVPGKKQEPDIEGAAAVQDLIFWMGSHGTDKNGAFQLARNCFFATRFTVEQGKADLQVVGVPYRKLIDDLAEHPEYHRFNLQKARYTPTKTREGLNIEGLATGPDGSLLIAFRSPLVEEKALVARLLNPGEVIHNNKARFAPPILVDLKGRGFRDLTWTGEQWIIIAGSWGAGGTPGLYSWSSLSLAPKLISARGLEKLNPEGITSFPGKDKRLLIISDDDTKDGRSTFRSSWLTLD